MGISKAEFIAAMDAFGAERLPDETGTRFAVSVPCYRVQEAIFLHSGSYYIDNHGRDYPEAMERAMREVGEKHPGGSNFWYGEIHSIKGMLTLALMIDDKYSKKNLDEMADKAYKKLFAVPSNIVYPITRDNNSQKIEKLYEVLGEYDKALYPFGSDSDIKLKNPLEYVDTINLEMSEYGSINESLWLKYKVGSYEVVFRANENMFLYQSYVGFWKNDKKASVEVRHYYDDRETDIYKKGKVKGEVIKVKYVSNKEGLVRHGDFDISISLQDFTVWNEGGSIELTDDHIEKMISYIKLATKKLKKHVISIMQSTDN